MKSSSNAAKTTTTTKADRPKLLPQQRAAVEWLCGRTETIVSLPIGYGKTIVSLSAFLELRKAHPTWRALLVSTVNICKLTWGQEIQKWNLPLSYISIAGSVRPTLGGWYEYDIVGVNFESFEKYLDLVDNGATELPEVLIIDESSKMKSSQAKRVKRLIGHCQRGGRPSAGYVHRFQRRWLLSGSPAPEGLEDLWAQEACASTKRRLGENITCFRERYCSTHWNGFANEFNVHTPGRAEIERVMSHIMYVPKEIDDLGLVPPTHSKVSIPWTKKAREEYDALEERLLFTPVDGDVDLDADEDEIVASNAGALLTKLRQLCSGFIYDATGRARLSSDPDAKGRALDSIVELAEGSPLLVFTQYIEEMEYLRRRYPKAQIRMPATLGAWEAGDVPMMVLHPRSAGHGLNLQGGSHICVFYSLPYSYEEWFQAWGRLHRRGQEKPVSVIRLEREDSVEADVWATLQSKKRSLSALLDNMRQRRIE